MCIAYECKASNPSFSLDQYCLFKTVSEPFRIFLKTLDQCAVAQWALGSW